MIKLVLGIGVWRRFNWGADWNAAWNWNRERQLAMTLCLPGICFAQKCMLHSKVANTRRRTNLMIILSFEDCLLMIWTTAILWDISSLILFPDVSMANTIGKSSLTAIWKPLYAKDPNEKQTTHILKLQQILTIQLHQDPLVMFIKNSMMFKKISAREKNQHSNAYCYVLIF